MREQSISRDRRQFTSSFEQESNFVVRNFSREFLPINNSTTEPQSPSAKGSLQGSSGFYNMTQTNNILNESVKEAESGQLGTSSNLVQ